MDLFQIAHVMAATKTAKVHILMDELMNYVSRNRKSGLATQLYNFLQNLSEEARGQDRVVLVASIPGPARIDR